MYQLFKTVLILSLFGFGLTALLLVFKPITAKKFPARWQYLVWIAVMISMLVPIYKLVPKQEAQKLVSIGKIDVIEPIATNDRVYTYLPDDGESPDAADAPRDITPEHRISLWNLASYIWFCGMLVYLLSVVCSYVIYLVKKKKSSTEIIDNELLDNVKAELGIRRKICLKKSGDISSPMLVGVFKPTIYIPDIALGDEYMRMVFMHELTHYKRGDLAVKWLAVFVNAVHWFNPFAYILCANVGEACEVSCDMTVTRNMTDEEQKLYMNTILDFAK